MPLARAATRPDHQHHHRHGEECKRRGRSPDAGRHPRTSTGTQRTATTNSAGEYAFPSLAPGDCDLKFTSAGFSLTDLHATLNVTERIAVDATMQVSGRQTSVNVSAEAPALQTADQTLGRTIDGQAIKQLPFATRNFTQILTLSPGTSAPLNDATALTSTLYFFPPEGVNSRR